jgi:hypothetical protein
MIFMHLSDQPINVMYFEYWTNKLYSEYISWNFNAYFEFKPLVSNPSPKSEFQQSINSIFEEKK